jgi:6-phosphogluconolactonase (cycloisomerase 2 family)
MTMRPNRWLIGILNTLCLATLAACGGGGGGGGTTGADPVPTVLGFAYVANLSRSTISAYELNSAGQISAKGTPLDSKIQPKSIVAHPSRKFAYVANYGEATVSAYSISPTGTLAEVNAGTVAAGTNPTAIAFGGSTKQYAYVTNVGSNNVSMYSIDGTTGALTHMGNIAAGSRPRSISIDSPGQFAYVANQDSFDISVYKIETNGTLTVVDQNGAVAGTTIGAGTNPSSIAVDPTGKYVYVTNQLTDDISSYLTDPNGLLTVIDQDGAGLTKPAGNAPVAMAFDPTGTFAYVANYDSNNISAYSIATGTGLLNLIGTYPAGSGPVFVGVDPTGNYAFVANEKSDDVSIYAISKATANPGTLSQVGSAVKVGTEPLKAYAPNAIAIVPAP